MGQTREGSDESRKAVPGAERLKGERGSPSSPVMVWGRAERPGEMGFTGRLVGWLLSQ